MLFGLAVLGGVVYGAIKLRPPKKPLIQKLCADPVSTPASSRRRARQHRLLSMLGSGCSQTLDKPTEFDFEPDVQDMEQWIQQYFVRTSAVLGIATIGLLLSPTLYLVSAAGVLFNGWLLFQLAYKSLFEARHVGIVVLDSVIVGGCLLTGYYFAAALGAWLFFLSQKLVLKTEDHSQKSLTNIFMQQQRVAWVVIDGTDLETPIDALQAADVVVVHAGETIPIDGTIVSGIASIDQHILTGEAQPVEREVDDVVYASTVVLSGKIYIRVEKTGAETTVAKIGEIWSQTTDYKKSLQSRGQAIVDRTALPMLGLGTLVFTVLEPIRAIAVMNANFGYNMRILAPIGALNYLSRSSRAGILIKDGRALEILNQVDTVVFDKTGTLTHEQPHVAQIHVAQSHEADDILRLAAAAEARQTHPIARAILQAAGQRELQVPEIDAAEYQVGYGLTVTVDHQMIRVGSARFMEMERVAPAPCISEAMHRVHRQGHSMVMVAIADQVVGGLELHVTPRPEAHGVITGLRQRHIESISIISGDHEAPTHTLANGLGIDRYFANTAPEHKAAIIKKLQDEGKVVCYIGDGINDAVALKQAQVSISLRGASTIATDTADIVLMDGSLTKLGDLFDIALSFERNLKTNFIWSVIPGILSISGVLFFHTSIVTSMLLNQVGLIAGLANIMRPLSPRSPVLGP